MTKNSQARNAERDSVKCVRVSTSSLHAAVEPELAACFVIEYRPAEFGRLTFSVFFRTFLQIGERQARPRGRSHAPSSCRAQVPWEYDSPCDSPTPQSAISARGTSRSPATIDKRLRTDRMTRAGRNSCRDSTSVRKTQTVGDCPNIAYAQYLGLSPVHCERHSLSSIDRTHGGRSHGNAT